MKDFQQFLTSGNFVSTKKVPFYLHWTRQFFSFCRKELKDGISNDEIQAFLADLSKRKEKWQVEQAREAIKLYLFFKNRPSKKLRATGPTKSQRDNVSHEMVKILRLKHLSLLTERTYLGWVKSFCHYLGSISPSKLNRTHLKSFLTHLAVERRVAASTQNQAFNALLFLYHNVLDYDLGDFSDTVRAKRKRYLPVVLSRQEIGSLFSCLTGINRLTARMIYGCGLRLKECIKLRIKDIDFDRNCVVFRGGKGDKDRSSF